jgi:glycosyltransferase involved in cell wall biosynthesis
LREIDQEVPVSPEELGASQSQKIVLHVGRFHDEKNLGNLVRALRLVMRRPGVVAFLCGDGPLVSATEELVREEGLSGRVFLPGYVTNIWRWMKRADVFVSASLFEGMPNTVMEAMACGCPIVVSDIPSHREILDENSATFIAPGDPESIAAGIDGLLENREEALRQVQCAKEMATRWSIPEMARRYEEVYFDILEYEGRSGLGQE